MCSWIADGSKQQFSVKENSTSLHDVLIQALAQRNIAADAGNCVHSRSGRCHIWFDLVIAVRCFDSTSSLLHLDTGVGSGGYAGDLTPPTIYVDGILICISLLEKPNT